MLRKLVKMAFLTLLTYLLQSTVPKNIAIGGVGPNIAIAVISIVSVGLGKKYTFLMSLAIGYLLEIMLPALDYINVILYPVSCMLGALLFSDKSERKLEEERTAGRRSKQLNPLLRTPLCALISIILFEAVDLLYTYLNGISISQIHIRRSIIDVFYTVLLSAVLQFPVRWMLRINSRAKKQA